jgi:DNA-binding transcriptional LysR family regulator
MPPYADQVDLDQLRTTIALLHHRTVNRTAAAEGLAPSSVSDRVRRLEAELGATLFARDRAGMHPTVAGRSYLAAAAAALDALDEAAERLRASSGLVVGAQASIADELLPAVLDELRAKHPDVPVQLRPDPDRARLLAALDRSEIDAVVLLDRGARIGDLGFTRPTSTMNHLDIREVPMVTVAAPGHPLLGHPVTTQEIRRTGGLIGRESRCSFWMATQRWLGPDVDLTAVGGLAQVREWVAAGRGIAVLPQFAVQADLDAGRLMKIDALTPTLQLRLIWLQEREATDTLRPLLYALSQA